MENIEGSSKILQLLALQHFFGICLPNFNFCTSIKELVKDC